uniref:LSM domain-containing protein n=1 Tax=Archaeoglobus fulgidus TaxID=2234 RepID=A0A7C2NR05_ARCFL
MIPEQNLQNEKKKKKRGKKAPESTETIPDFLHEVLGRNIAVVFHNGETVAGRLLELSKFWIKVEDANGQIVHMNKAFITRIYPITKQ